MMNAQIEEIREEMESTSAKTKCLRYVGFTSTEKSLDDKAMRTRETDCAQLMNKILQQRYFVSFSIFMVMLSLFCRDLTYLWLPKSYDVIDLIPCL